MKFLHRPKRKANQPPVVRESSATQSRTPSSLDLNSLIKSKYALRITPSEHPEDRKARNRRELITHVGSVAALYAVGAVLSYLACARETATDARTHAVDGLIGLAAYVGFRKKTGQ